LILTIIFLDLEISYTMSPQVLKGVYTSQSDLWAIGVIAYMLLSSSKPFFNKNRRKMIELIMHGELRFDSARWEHVSSDAKDFVEHLLRKDPEQRLDAPNAMKHQWICEREQLPDELPSKEVLDSIDDSFLNYQRTSHLKKLALTVIAHRSTTKEILELRKVFDSFDTVKDGVLSYSEFKAALVAMNFPEKEISSVFATLVSIFILPHSVSTFFVIFKTLT
jgi:calcium-dependent protein kinase